MTDSFRSSVAPRLLAELGVIVLGVLLALGVDAMWERRGELILEESVLASLAEELRLLDQQLDSLERRDSLIVHRADAFPLQSDDVSLDSVSALVAEMFSTVPREPFLPTYDELVSTGNLRVLSDRSLRLLLTRFASEARTLTGYTQQMDTQWNVTARPVLYEAVAWPANPGAREPRVWTERAPRLAPEELDRLRNVVRDRRGFANVHWRLVRSMRDLVTELVEATDGALDRR
ncbi:MAG: hypothetical protein OEZ65_10320 [Gemmatimonadota bacterium]|nr:hypothetical protein [Gemmatimonadota bacterium]MDH5759973.1 hypothetical protein [Gemmatimonadota bacterium]